MSPPTEILSRYQRPLGERTRERRWLVSPERRGHWKSEELVGGGALGQCGGVQRGRLQRGVIPAAGVDPLEQHLQRRDRLRSRKRAVARSLHEDLAQHLGL